MIHIRKATPEDAADLAQVYVETWRSTYAGILPDRVLLDMSTERQAINWARALGHGIETVVLAEDGGQGVVGLGSCGPNRDENSTFAGEIYTLYVLPDFQDTGIGEALLAALFRALIGAGRDAAVIWVLADNPSRFFYEAMGGKHRGERTEKLWGQSLRENAYCWDGLARALAAGRPRRTDANNS